MGETHRSQVQNSVGWIALGSLPTFLKVVKKNETFTLKEDTSWEWFGMEGSWKCYSSDEKVSYSSETLIGVIATMTVGNYSMIGPSQVSTSFRKYEINWKWKNGHLVDEIRVVGTQLGSVMFEETSRHETCTRKGEMNWESFERELEIIFL